MWLKQQKFTSLFWKPGARKQGIGRVGSCWGCEENLFQAALLASGGLLPTLIPAFVFMWCSLGVCGVSVCACGIICMRTPVALDQGPRESSRTSFQLIPSPLTLEVRSWIYEFGGYNSTCNSPQVISNCHDFTGLLFEVITESCNARTRSQHYTDIFSCISCNTSPRESLGCSLNIRVSSSSLIFPLPLPQLPPLSFSSIYVLKPHLWGACSICPIRRS